MKSLCSISEDNGNGINLEEFPDLANKSLGCSVKWDYQISNKYFLRISMSHVGPSYIKTFSLFIWTSNLTGALNSIRQHQNLDKITIWQSWLNSEGKIEESWEELVSSSRTVVNQLILSVVRVKETRVKFSICNYKGNQ